MKLFTVTAVVTVVWRGKKPPTREQALEALSNEVCENWPPSEVPTLRVFPLTRRAQVPPGWLDAIPWSDTNLDDDPCDNRTVLGLLDRVEKDTR